MAGAVARAVGKGRGQGQGAFSVPVSVQAPAQHGLVASPLSAGEKESDDVMESSMMLDGCSERRLRRLDATGHGTPRGSAPPLSDR